MTIYLIIVSAVLAFLCIIWKHEDWFNALMKFIFLVLACFGVFFAMANAGYIIAP